MRWWVRLNKRSPTGDIDDDIVLMVDAKTAVGAIKIASNQAEKEHKVMYVVIEVKQC